jgi:hypothetical protein
MAATNEWALYNYTLARLLPSLKRFYASVKRKKPESLLTNAKNAINAAKNAAANVARVIVGGRAASFARLAERVVGGASAHVTFICALCTLRAQISLWINMRLHTLQRTAVPLPVHAAATDNSVCTITSI